MSGKINIHHDQLNWEVFWFTIMLDLLVENHHSWKFSESQQLLKHNLTALYFIYHANISAVSIVPNINYIFYEAIFIAQVFQKPVFMLLGKCLIPCLISNYQSLDRREEVLDWVSGKTLVVPCIKYNQMTYLLLCDHGKCKLHDWHILHDFVTEMNPVYSRPCWVSRHV